MSLNSDFYKWDRACCCCCNTRIELNCGNFFLVKLSCIWTRYKIGLVMYLFHECGTFVMCVQLCTNFHLHSHATLYKFSPPFSPSFSCNFVQIFTFILMQICVMIFLCVIFSICFAILHVVNSGTSDALILCLIVILLVISFEGFFFNFPCWTWHQRFTIF